MSALTRVTAGVRSVLTDPVERRAYAGRLRWLLNGSGSLQAWSLEYRAGLIGRFAVDAERIAPDARTTVACPDDCSANAPLAHLYQQRHVYRLHGSVASTATGATLVTSTPEPPFFVRESITWPFESILSHGLDIPGTDDARQGPSDPTVVFPTNPNYYHWLVEELPLVLRAQAAVPDVQAVAFGPAVTERHTIVANELGLRLRSAPLVVSLPQQVLPGRGDDSWFIHPADARALFDLGERLSGGTASPAGERIYVSRRSATRSIPEEAALERLLEEQGFTVVQLETVPWTQQIAMFRDARVVVGLHGAGLANLVFTPPGATLVELTNGYHYNRCFEFVCHVAGHRYVGIDSDATPGSASATRLAAEVAACT